MCERKEGDGKGTCFSEERECVCLVIVVSGSTVVCKHWPLKWGVQSEVGRCEARSFEAKEIGWGMGFGGKWGISGQLPSTHIYYVWVGDRISLNFLEGRSGDEVVIQD